MDPPGTFAVGIPVAVVVAGDDADDDDDDDAYDGGGVVDLVDNLRFLAVLLLLHSFADGFHCRRRRHVLLEECRRAWATCAARSSTPSTRRRRTPESRTKMIFKNSIYLHRVTLLYELDKF